MRCLSDIRLLLLLVALFVVGLGAPAAGAAETSNSEFVIIPEGETFTGDLYAGSIRVIIRGTLEGDLFAATAQDVVVSGTVVGSVTAISPAVVIEGEVTGSTRAFGNRVSVSGTVGGDLVVAARVVELSESSKVGGDVLAWSWSLTSDGEIGADVGGIQWATSLGGAISGDVDISVRSLDIEDSLTVQGDLAYRSSREATGVDNAEVGGAVVHKTPLPPNLRVRALRVLGQLMVVLFFAVAALAAVYGWPERTRRAVTEVSRRTFSRWALGALILGSPLLMMIVTWALLVLAPPTASFPLLLVLVPVLLALVGVVMALGVVAGAPVVAWVGGVVFPQLDMAGAVVAGSLLAGVVWLVPIVGWLVPLVVLPIGLGAWIASGRRDHSEPATAF